MKGSLTLAPGYVENAHALALEKPFVPEKTVFGEYTFLPWVRNGLAAALVPPAGDGIRATVQVSMGVQDDAGTRVDVPPQTLTLRGPGDVIGFDAGQIIRRFPIGGTIDAEESLLVHIEFDRPELPWLFSPLAPEGDQLRPWLALIVCEAALSKFVPSPPGFPQQIKTRRSELQPLDDSWAWAHAQIIGPSAGAPSITDRLSADYGPANLSRLLCPRKLSPKKNYIACLVPAFECGRQAAMGSSGGSLGPAWSGGNPDETIVLPVFDSWEFSTATEGDFEKLAKRLHGIPAPWNVGRRIIDAQNPRGGIAPLPAGAPGGLQVLRCALVSTTPIPLGEPQESSAWDLATREKLREQVDLHNEPDADLPRVGARLYARYQRAQAQLGPVLPTFDSDWFPQLNTTPTHRIVAALGTRVVQRDQEQLMQAAWAQVGEIRKANEALVRIQFGRYVAEALHRNHLAKLALGDLAQMLRGAHDKVRVAGAALTMHGTVERSAVPAAAMMSAFRRVTRVRGPLARFGAVALRQLVAKGAAFRDLRRLYVEPEGIATLSSEGIASFSPALVARKLGVSEVTATRALEQRFAARRDALTIADRLALPLATWKVREGTLELGTRAAAQIADSVAEALPARLANDAARNEALVPLLVGIGNSGVRDISTKANATIGRIDRRLPFSAIPSGIGLPGHIGVAVSDRIGAVNVPRVSAATAELQPRLRFETEVSRQITATVVKTQAVTFRDTATALSHLALGDGIAALPLTPDRPALAFTREVLLTAVVPATTLTPYAVSRLSGLPKWLAPDWFFNGRIAPIMAAPRFDRAMFEALDAYDREWLIPGLGKIEFTDWVTVLETNPQFTESFLIGLSDEMGRELLWRGYPTDQRGTYFHRFWDQERDELGTPIHRFARTPLGSHLEGGDKPRVVLVVRGELVRRHPDVLCVAMRAGGADAEGRPVFIDPETDPSSVARILFHHHLAPDILLVGYDLSPSQVRAEPWWFLLVENPSAPRFGLDLADEPNPVASDGVARNDLDWNDLGALVNGHFLSALGSPLTIFDKESDPKNATWPGNAAIVARTLLQNPVRAAFDAHKLIAPAL